MFVKTAAAAATLLVLAEAGKTGLKYKLFKNKLNWADAKKACKNWGGQLGEINSKADQKKVFKATGKTSKATWFAANDHKQEGKWVQGGKAMSYTNWGKGEPNNYWKKEDCAAFWGKDGKWNDWFCNKKAQYICEKNRPVAPKPAETADFSDDSFLGGLDSFKEAEARRAVFLAKHMALVKARYVKAKIYFNAKDVAAEKVRIEGEWNTKWLAAVKKHDDAIAKHEHAKKATIDAMTVKRNAIHAKLQASEAATAAKALKLHALGNWNAAKLASAKAHKAHVRAVKAHKHAEANEDKKAKKLEDAEAHQAAMKDEFELREKNHDGALATEKEAAAKQAEAEKAHKAAEAAQAHADGEERVAARARSAALASYRQAQTEKTEAVNMKAAALARAIAASKDVRTHMKANWMYAL